MEFTEVIIKWLKNDATKEEIQKIFETASRELEITDQKLAENGIYIMTTRSYLEAIKYVKDKTGMGLKEAKEFCDTYIRPYKSK